MQDGRYIGKFYSVPHFWMVILAVYGSSDGSKDVMERHVAWNEDTSKDASCSFMLSAKVFLKGTSFTESLLLMEAKDAVELMKLEWKAKFLPGEKEEIKFQSDDLKELSGPDMSWYRLSGARFFNNAFKEISEKTHCQQLKEHLDRVLQKG